MFGVAVDVIFIKVDVLVVVLGIVIVAMVTGVLVDTISAFGFATTVANRRLATLLNISTDTTYNKG